MPQLVLHEQTNGRPPVQAQVLDWQDGVPLTPRMLIAERVRLEWEKRQAEREALAAQEAHGVATPGMMRRLNPFRSRHTARAEPDPGTVEDATMAAVDGFRRNAFFLVVDGRQATELDATIPLRPTSNVTFVRLVPLKGG